MGSLTAPAYTGVCTLAHKLSSMLRTPKVSICYFNTYFWLDIGN